MVVTLPKPSRGVASAVTWTTLSFVALLLLDLVDLILYGLVVPGLALALAVVTALSRPALRSTLLARRVDRVDLAVVGLVASGPRSSKRNVWTSREARSGIG
jgi:hypothetical protein